MRTIKANTKANGDILPEPKFKRIPVRVDKNTIILVRAVSYTHLTLPTNSLV